MINECQIINVWHQCLWRRIWFLCLINIFVHISRQPSDVENCHISSTKVGFEKEKVDPIMFRGWTCDTWLGKPLGGTLGKWIMVVIFQIGHSHNTRFRKSYKINWNHLKLNHEVNNVSKLLIKEWKISNSMCFSF